MKNVIELPTASAPSMYVRPPLRWITRRARRIERFYKVTRRVAIFDAWLDYIEFSGLRVITRPAAVLPFGDARHDH